MRKGHDGLSSIVENHMKEDLLSGSIFLFVNKRMRLCKALYFDGTGLVIIHKRLEVGSFMSLIFLAKGKESLSKSKPPKENQKDLLPHYLPPVDPPVEKE